MFRWARYLLWLLAAPIVSAQAEKLAELRNPGPPRFAKDLIEGMEKCVRDEANSGLFFERDARWVLTCPYADFKRIIQLRDSRNPAYRILAGKIVLFELKRMRDPFLKPPASPTNKKRSASFPALPEMTELGGSSDYTVNRPEPSDDAAPLPELVGEMAYFKASDPYLVDASGWLKSVYKNSNSLLNYDAAYLYFQILGESLRFNEIPVFLNEQQSLLLSKKSSQFEIYRQILSWLEVYPNTALSNWLAEKFTTSRPAEITGTSDSELFFWINSLALSPPPNEASTKQTVLRKLRELWIAFPSDADSKQIRQAADKIGLGPVFKAPLTREFSFRELMIRSKAQIRAVDTLGALRTIRRVLLLSHDEASTEDLWDALQLHIRILRILDERPQIPGIISSYLRSGGYLKKPSKNSEMSSYLSRALDIARFYWSYDSPEKASEVLNMIIQTNQKNRTDFQLGTAMVIRARLAEQAREREKAMQYMDQALQSRIPTENMIDLLWRKFFIQMEINGASGAKQSNLLTLLEPLKKFSNKDIGEKGRWLFWQAKVFLMLGREDEGIESFFSAYQADPFSYYSNMAGLELKKLRNSPRGWVLVSREELPSYDQASWSQPNWELYFSDSGVLKDPAYKDLARSYFLATLGDFHGASRAFFDVDKLLWQRVLSTRFPWQRRRDLARTASWLRTALNDPMGGLRATEIARQAKGEDLEREDYYNLYPLPFWKNIQSESNARGVNPWLVASLIRQESAFNPKARSWANALGLMQMIPPVALEEATALKMEKFDPEQLYDPATAVKLGTNHLSRILKQFENSWICSIAAYNAGSPPIEKWLKFYLNENPLTFVERIPFQETRNYVKSIFRNYINYQRIYGKTDSNFSPSLAMPTRMPGNTVSQTQSASKNEN